MGAERMGAIGDEGRDANSGNLNKYYYVNKDDLERDGFEMFKPADGPNFVAVIPPADGHQFYAREVYKHSNVGVERGTFLCVNKTRDMGINGTKQPWGERCPICEKHAALVARNPESKLAADIRPQQRFLCFLVDVQKLKPASTMEEMEALNLPVKWWDAPKGFRDGCVSISQDKRTKDYVTDISDPDKGYTVVFSKKGQKKQTTYSGFEKESRNPIPDSWLKIPEYDLLLIIPTLAQLEAAVSGIPTDAAAAVEGDSRRTRGQSNQAVGEDGTVSRRERRPGSEEPAAETTREPAAETTRERTREPAAETTRERTREPAAETTRQRTVVEPAAETAAPPAKETAAPVEEAKTEVPAEEVKQPVNEPEPAAAADMSPLDKIRAKIRNGGPA